MKDNDQGELFDDEPKSEEAPEGATKESEDEGKTKEEDEGEETGEKEESTEPPSGDKKEGEEEVEEKMIPESRFKAAIKDVSEKLEVANQKLSKYEQTPIPDKDKDPEGWNLHVKMEASRTVMRETTPDYDEVIDHYVKMAEANPYLNDAVAKHPAPAKYAYDIAKKDLEVKEALALKGSDEWKEFQEFKKSKKQETPADKDGQTKAGKQVAASLTSKVPNLNKATDVSKASKVSEDTDELFQGAL